MAGSVQRVQFSKSFICIKKAIMISLSKIAVSTNKVISKYFSKYKSGQNICRLFHFLAKFVFTTSETELDYYHQKVNGWVAERLKTYDLRKIPEMFGFNDEYPAVHPKAKFWHFLVKYCKKSTVKHYIEKPILLNFVNLSPTVCPRLYLF